MNTAENAGDIAIGGDGKGTAPITEDSIAYDAALEMLSPDSAAALTAVQGDSETVPQAAPANAKTDLTPPIPSTAIESEQASAVKEYACPNCGCMVRVGELVCSNCQFVFSNSVSTHRIEETEVVMPSRPQQTGDAIATEEKPITLEIDGTVLNLSIHETLVVGRRVVGEEPPDVDLTSFRAEEQGVSRRHLRLSRRGSLIYITDLHSTNRTYLNGYKLIPEGERLVRSGDEIRLGRLKIKVRF